MTWDDIDLNSIIIIVGAICIGIIKVIEMYKSGSYRSTKLNNSKEEMKQVEALRSKYREKFKNQIKDVKEDMLKEIKNKKFDDEFDNIIERLMELYNNTNELITSRSSSTSGSNSEEIVEDKKEHPVISNKEGKLILKDIGAKRRSRMQSTKEEFAEKVRDNIIKKLSEHDDVEIEMEDK